MNDREILDVSLDLLENDRYRDNDKCRESILTIARFAFNRLTTVCEELTQEEWAALRFDKNKLQAVRLFRERHKDLNGGKSPFSLMEIKKIIERHMEKEFGFTHFPIQ